MDDPRRKHRQMKKSFFLWIFVLIFLTTYSFHGNQNTYLGFFSIKKIEIIGTKFSNKNDLERKFVKILNKNIIFLNSKDLEKTINTKVDFINSLKIKKVYPSKVIVKVLENSPIGIYSDDNNVEYLLLENNKVKKNDDNKFQNLPKVYGPGAIKRFSDFYSSLEKINFDLSLVKQFDYHSVNRWDLSLVDGKLIKLPPENYQDSVLKFIEIYKKSNFKKFKVYDFRIKNELILK